MNASGSEAGVNAWGPKSWDGDKMSDLLIQLVSAVTAVTTEAELREKEKARAESDTAAHKAYVADLERAAERLAQYRNDALEQERRYNDAMVAAVRDGFALLAAAVREGKS